MDCKSFMNLQELSKNWFNGTYKAKPMYIYIAITNKKQ